MDGDAVIPLSLRTLYTRFFLSLKFKIQEASQSIQQILDYYQCEDASTFFTNKARYSLIVENIKQADSRMSGLLTNTSINDIKSRQLELLKENRASLDKIALELLEKETLYEDELNKLAI